jgi:hypothetical protein
MTGQMTMGQVLPGCTVRLDVGGASRGTAFFAAPQYALTTAHNIAGLSGVRVEMAGSAAQWTGEVEDVRPSAGEWQGSGEGLHPPPDVALIRLKTGPSHPCVPLSRTFPVIDRRVLVRGYSRSFNGSAVTAESEAFTVTGELDTTNPDCTLLKLGAGQAVHGMSGGPVLDATEGQVVGMLRTTRDAKSALGAWVVPAEFIRRLWPELAKASDHFQEESGQWRAGRPMPEAGEQGSSAESSGGISIGKIVSRGSVGIINGGTFRDIHIGDGGTN